MNGKRYTLERMAIVISGKIDYNTRKLLETKENI